MIDSRQRRQIKEHQFGSNTIILTKFSRYTVMGNVIKDHVLHFGTCTVECQINDTRYLIVTKLNS